jgi:DNA ligase-1
MNYNKLAGVYEQASSTTKRLEKTSILADFLKKVSEKNKDLMYLLMGDIYPEYDERKIGISHQLAIKAISKATGTTPENVTKEWKKLGDLGLVSEKLTENKKQSTLNSHTITIQKVIENLRKLPDLEGKGTVGKKLGLITELLTSATPLESKYLIRTLIGDLRIGIQESTIREALAKAFFPKKENASSIVQSAIDKSNDVGIVFELCKKHDLKDLKELSLQIGRPIKAMLAQKEETIEDGFKAVGKPCAVEYKYDGFRLIIHKKGKEIFLFTRRLENVTKQFPEIKEYIEKYVKADSFILDAEAVGFHKETKEYMPFQDISQRIRRKYNIEDLQKKLPVELNVFDVLLYNGKPILDKPFQERTKILHKILEDHPYKIIKAKQIITDNVEKATKFYKAALKDNQEGVMMKKLDAPYKPGRRVGQMIKVKPDERDLDLVITGAEYGTGKRSGTLSSFILSCGKDKKFLEIGKMSTGIKEKAQKSKDGKEEVTYEEMTKLLTPLITGEKGRVVQVKPKIIVAIHYQEIQKSPNYKSGFALRFPRFTALRHEKPLSEITTLKEIEDDLKNQKRNYQYG